MVALASTLSSERTEGRNACAIVSRSWLRAEAGVILWQEFEEPFYAVESQF